MSDTAIEIRLCDEDLARWGGDEWLTIDLAEYKHLPDDELIKLEEGMGMSFFRLRRIEAPENTARGIKAMAWLARQRAGLTEPDFGKFRIHPGLVRTRMAGDTDPDPLTETSSAGERREVDTTPSTTSGAKGSKRDSGKSRQRLTAPTRD